MFQLALYNQIKCLVFLYRHNSSLFVCFSRRLRVLTASVENVEFCLKLLYKLVSSLSVKYSQFCIVVMLLKINVSFSLVLSQLDKSIYRLFAIIESGG